MESFNLEYLITEINTISDIKLHDIYQHASNLMNEYNAKKRSKLLNFFIPEVSYSDLSPILDNLNVLQNDSDMQLFYDAAFKNDHPFYGPDSKIALKDYKKSKIEHFVEANPNLELIDQDKSNEITAKLENGIELTYSMDLGDITLFAEVNEDISDQLFDAMRNRVIRSYIVDNENTSEDFYFNANIYDKNEIETLNIVYDLLNSKLN